MMSGVLKLAKLRAKDVMIPMESVYILSDETVLNEKYDINNLTDNLLIA